MYSSNVTMTTANRKTGKLIIYGGNTAYPTMCHRFRMSLRWPIHIIKPVDKTKLSFNTPTDTAPYPLYPTM